MSWLFNLDAHRADDVLEVRHDRGVAQEMDNRCRPAGHEEPHL